MLIDKTRTRGFDVAIRAMRNPLDSWDKSDSNTVYRPEYIDWFILGESDRALARRLILAGDEHAKFARFIITTCDIKAPLNWWHDFDTYKHGVERLSCSTMHRLGTRELDENDFEGQVVDYDTLVALNALGQLYRENKDFKYRYALRNKLPWNYLQQSTVQFSYQALRRIYLQRKTHRLPEWHILCLFIEKLPWFEDLIYPEYNSNDDK